MEHYWELVGASSEAFLYRTHTFSELCRMGYYYTVSSATRCSKCDMTRASIGAVLVSRYSERHYREAILEARDRGDARFGWEILNDFGMYSPTGKKWSKGLYRMRFKGIPRGGDKKKPVNYDWYVEVNTLWRTIVEEVGCTSLNAVCGEMVSRGVVSKQGKVLSRQSLTYIVERCPEMDWSVVSVDDVRAERVRELSSLLEGLDLGQFATKKDVYKHLGVGVTDQSLMSSVLDDNGWRRNKDEWHDYWNGVFSFIRTAMESEGWLGWNGLADRFVSCGVFCGSGAGWSDWRLSRMCRKYGFDKESEYVLILKSYVGSYLGSYVGSSVLGDLCDDLNARGYVMPNWFGIREGARREERLWTEGVLQRAFREGLL